MKTIFESCKPREEVLQGELKDEIFRASLTDVHSGKAEAVYQDPSVFFEHTYRTDGLKTLLKEAMGRLTGVKPSNNPVIRLETSFGGGKTHNLIALYHLARGKVTHDKVPDLVPSDLLPAKPIRVISLVGSDLEPSTGMPHGGVTTYTLWGEMAFQAGGQGAYEILELQDRERSRPGESKIKEVLGDDPTLILIDELAAYLRAAQGINLGDTTLAGMTTAFLMSLLGAVGGLPNTVVVYTLAESSDAFAKETDMILEALAEASRISARQERVITPTDETEIAPIVTRRMFEAIDSAAASEVAGDYNAFYKKAMEQGVDLPPRAGQAEYTHEMAISYPFHPELLTTLNRKTSTIPNFQKTRGALRLLGMVIRRLWGKKPKDTFLIHPYHLDLGVEDILNDLTSRLERPKFRHVAEADIVTPLKGSKAHAQDIDEPWLQADKPPYAGRASTAIFLHSIVHGVASGVAPADLQLAVLQPGDEPGFLQKALDRLYDTCWFLEYDGNRYRFKTEPSINKIIEDEMQLVGQSKAKTELDSRIQGIWKKGPLCPEYFPAEAADIDDDTKEPKLVVIHYDAASTGQGNDIPPDLVLKIFERTGVSEGYRRYKNNLLFLVSDKDQVEPMVKGMRRYMAIKRIVRDEERIKEFTKADREKLKSELDQAELFVRVAITRVYRWLYYPSADAPKKTGYLLREAIPAQDQGEVQKDQSQVILKRLKDLNKVLTADDAPLPSAYLKAKAWPGEQSSMTTEAMRKAFTQKLSLKMLLDINQLKKTIRNGIEQGTWVYFDSDTQRGYGKGAPPPPLHISEDTMLYTPEEAERLGIWPPRETCPICGKNKSECICEPELCPVCKRPVQECICSKTVCPRCGKDPCVCEDTLKAEGPPAQVLQSIYDQAQDRGVMTLSSLRIRIEGMGPEAVNDIVALGLAVPQMGKADCSVNYQLTAEFGPGHSFKASFNGAWDRYKRLKSVTDAFAKEASSASAQMNILLGFQEGLEIQDDRFSMIREILTSLQIGKVQVVAETEREGEGA